MKKSFQQKLQERRNKLKPTETRVLTEEGKMTVEKRDADGHPVPITGPVDRIWALVWDPTPDLQVGEVLNGQLYVGGQDVAFSRETLTNLKITHVLNLATLVANAFEDDSTLHITYKALQVLDLPSEDLKQHFRGCIQWIEQALKDGGRVFVHCNAGVSRSSTICIAYLIDRFGMTYDEAYAKVKEARPRICPNPGFVAQLRDFEKERKKASSL